MNRLLSADWSRKCRPRCAPDIRGKEMEKGDGKVKCRSKGQYLVAKWGYYSLRSPNFTPKQHTSTFGVKQLH